MLPEVMDNVEGKTSVKRAVKRAATTTAKKLREGQLKDGIRSLLRNQLLESVGHPSQKKLTQKPTKRETDFFRNIPY